MFACAHALVLDNFALRYSAEMLGLREARAAEVVAAHAVLAAANSALNPLPFVDSLLNVGIVLSMNHEISRWAKFKKRQYALFDFFCVCVFSSRRFVALNPCRARLGRFEVVSVWSQSRWSCSRAAPA